MSEVTLRNWTLVQTKYGVPILIADTVHNHPLLGTQRYGHSTAVIWLSMERGLAQTLNTLYHLEEPDPKIQTPEIQALIAKLHPENVPEEIRRAMAERKPWPGTDFENDIVAHWNIERWTGLKKGVDFLADDNGSSDTSEN